MDKKPDSGDTEGGDAPAESDQYRRLVDGATGHALFMLDTEGCIAIWPTAARTLYGYTDADAVGRHIELLFADRDEHSYSVAELLSEARDEATEVEHWHERKDGSVFWANCTLAPLSNGAFEGYTVVAQDTTTRKQYERMLERQNDRLKEFTDILSHDLQSPLAVVDGRLELYRETGSTEHLTVIEETIDRMERLVEDLLRVARQGQIVEHPEPTNLDTVVDIAREGTVPASATVQYEPIPMVMADTDRLVQLFENLFGNAVEHGGEDVCVRVGPLVDGFFIEDDGPGIPAADRKRVFDHGYTTREEGTGYGLSIVRSVVGAHGWDIVVTDGDDGGTRFEITGIEFVSDP